VYDRGHNLSGKKQRERKRIDFILTITCLNASNNEMSQSCHGQALIVAKGYLGVAPEADIRAKTCPKLQKSN
jgi:hypothetical protein